MAVQKTVEEWHSGTTINAPSSNMSTNLSTNDEQYTERDLAVIVSYARRESKEYAVHGRLALAVATRQFLQVLIDEPVSGRSVSSMIHAELQKKSGGDLYNTLLDATSTGATSQLLAIESMNDLWDVLKHEKRQRVNTPNALEGATFGRILRICSPLPAVVLQLLACYGVYFDIELLLSTFVGKSPTHAFLPDVVDPANRMTWSFSIKYYYLSQLHKDVFPGQVSGTFHQSSPHTSICRGRSTIAVSFARKSNTSSSQDDLPSLSLTDPWRILVLACRIPPQREYTSALGNGVEAYLWSISNEITAVRRSLQDLSDEILKTVMLSDEFLFDDKLQRDLLFEDADYSLSKTYFWALQSLRMTNECIGSLIKAWQGHSTMSLWKYLPASESSNDETWSHGSLAGSPPKGRSRTTHPYMEEIERQLGLLKATRSNNQARQEEIQALRDGLLNASAVREARMTIKQGKNIRILTMISMLFLPASFVTSIFGMETVLPSSTTIGSFAAVFALVCGITYLILFYSEFENRRSARKKPTDSTDNTHRLDWMQQFASRRKHDAGAGDVEHQ